MKKGGIGMAEWLTLKLVSEKHGIPESTLQCWKKRNYIASSTVDDTVMLDEEDVIHLLDTHQTDTWSEDAPEEIIPTKEAERKALLSQLDNEMFLLLTLKQHQPLFHAVIGELGALINDEKRREIFLAVSGGEPILQVAQQHGMSCAKTQRIYSEILDKLDENMERIVSRYGEVIRRLCWKFNIDTPMNIPLSHILNLHAYAALENAEEIKTLQELLEFTDKWGWRRLKNINGIGNMTYKHIINVLRDEGIITISPNGTIGLIPEIAAIML